MSRVKPPSASASSPRTRRGPTRWSTPPPRAAGDPREKENAPFFRRLAKPPRSRRARSRRGGAAREARGAAHRARAPDEERARRAERLGGDGDDVRVMRGRRHETRRFFFTNVGRSSQQRRFLRCPRDPRNARFGANAHSLLRRASTPGRSSKMPTPGSSSRATRAAFETVEHWRIGTASFTGARPAESPVSKSPIEKSNARMARTRRSPRRRLRRRASCTTRSGPPRAPTAS